jgi:hypothetical protein
VSNVVRPRVALVRGASVALLTLLTLVTRASMRAQVFDRGEVTPVEVDAFYHLRRIARTAEHFPTLPLRDPLVDWPRGAVVPWPEGFDWTIAALARLTGHSTPHAVGVFAAWFPVAAGLAVVLATYALCLRLLRGERGASGAAFLAGLVAALAPQSVATSLVGRIDHHVAEQASVLALLGWCLARPAADATPARALRFELAGAAALGLSLWCFNGSVLYAAVAAGVLAVRALAEVDRPRRAGTGAPAFALAALFVAWRSAPAVHAHGRAFDYLYTSYLQPALLLVFGALLLAAAEVARLDRAGATATPARRVARRAAAAALVGTAALGLLGALVPPIREAVTAGARRWLAREDPYMATIAEVRPLFAGGAREAAATVYRTLGVAGFVHPLAMLAALLGMARARRRGAPELGAFWLALTALAAMQMRFGRVLAPVAGLAIGAGAWALATRLRWAPWALAALWLLDPRARTWLRARPAGAVDVVHAARFLRGAAGAGDGVFTTWDDGNQVLQKAGLPVMVTSFGSYVAPEAFWRSERAWLGTEAALDATLDARHARWIVAGADHFGGAVADATLPPPLAGGGFNTAFFRRVPLAGLVVGGSGAPRAGVAQLEHWLPRLAVGVALRTRETVVPTLWVYERVAGATVRGNGPEGALVTLTTRLLLDGTPARHVAWARVASGVFALRTALPTRWRSANLATPDAATLVVGDEAARPVEVPEMAVRGGRELAVAAP